MSHFSKRLKELRTKHGYTQPELAAKIGVSKSSVNMYERGEREPGFEVMEAIADTFNVNMDYLYGIERSGRGRRSALGHKALRVGRAYERASSPVRRTVEVALEPFFEDDVSFVDFELSEQKASAGTGVFLSDEHMTSVSVRLDALPEGYGRDPSRYYGVPVGGDSMEPKYSDGDILIVSKEPLDVGEIGIVVMDGEGYVKKIGNGALVSLNPKYKDIPINESIHFCGKVVGVLDPNAF